MYYLTVLGQLHTLYLLGLSNWICYMTAVIHHYYSHGQTRT